MLTSCVYSGRETSLVARCYGTVLAFLTILIAVSINHLSNIIYQEYFTTFEGKKVIEIRKKSVLATYANQVLSESRECCTASETLYRLQENGLNLDTKGSDGLKILQLSV